uniref:Uncharacterized protein n=1 Tax=Photinus pyralis TaxID=7054 RepID=A0A1Y1L187_PHOPY
MLRHHVNSQASSLQLQEPPGPSEVFRANPKGISSSHRWIAREDTVPLNKPVKVPQNPIGMYACRKNDANSRIARHQKAKVMPPSAQMLLFTKAKKICDSHEPTKQVYMPTGLLPLRLHETTSQSPQASCKNVAANLCRIRRPTYRKPTDSPQVHICFL